MSASLQQTLQSSSGVSGGSVFLSREEHARIVTGTETGPADWRDQQDRQDVLKQQTDRLVEAVDDLSGVLRMQLADDLVEFLPLVDRIADLPCLYPPDRDAAWRFGGALRQIGRLLEDRQAYAQDVIAAAQDLLDAEDRGPDRLGCRIEWPFFEHEDDRQELRAVLKRIVALPWATPRPGGEKPEKRGLITGESRDIDSPHELRFFPTVAQRKRRPTLNTLRYWLENSAKRDHEGQVYARFVVVTAGRRIPYGGDLQGALRGLNRKISRWAVESAQEWGVDLVFRGDEFTLDDFGAHPHANVVIEPQRRLSKARWRDYLRAMNRHFGAWTRDNGRVEDCREIVKYVVKPGDLEERILDLEDRGERLRRTEWIYRALLRTRLTAFYGDTRELRADFEDRKVKPCVVGGAVRLVPKFEPAQQTKQKDRSGENVILAFGLADREFTPYAEPSVLVMGYTETPKTKAGQKRLKIIQQAADEALTNWMSNGAPAPETAKAIARAWRAADSDEEARKIRALGRNYRPPESEAIRRLSTPAPRGAAAGACAGAASAAPFIVHTVDLTVRPESEPEPDSWNTGPQPPPPDPDTIVFRSGRQIRSGYEIDPETGRSLGAAGHVRKKPEMRLDDVPVWMIDDPAVDEICWMMPDAIVTESGSVCDPDSGEIIGCLSRRAMKRVADHQADIKRRVQAASFPSAGAA